MRRIQLTFVAVFFALIGFPLLQMAVPLVRISPVEENRLPAPLPDFAEIVLHGDGRLATPINRWFDDRIGFRALFIRLYNQLDYSLFRHSARLYIGRDGTLFLRDFVDAKIAHERAGAPWQQAIQEQFLALARHLERRGIRLVIVSNPAKASVLTDRLPPDAPRLPSPSQFDTLRRFLSGHPAWIHVDGQSVMGQCGDYPLFYRTDIHLTMPAGYCIAQEIVSRIAVAEGHPPMLWSPQVMYQRKDRFSGGLATFLAVLFKPTEPIELPETIYHAGQAAPDGSFERDPDGFFETIYRTHEPRRGAKLPPMVLYGNSFAADYLRSGLFFQFADVHSVRNNDIPLKDALARLPPATRYLIVQLFEPFLGDFLQAQIPE